MITLTCNSYNLLKSPSPVVIETDQDDFIPGQAGIYDLDINFVPQDGENLVLSNIADGVLSFRLEFTTAPGSRALDVDVSGSLSLNDWIDQRLIPALQAHATLNSMYSFANSGGSVRFTAKENGPAYKLNYIDGTLLDVFFVQEVQAGTEDQDPDTLRLYIDLRYKQLNAPGGYSKFHYLLNPDTGKVKLYLDQIFTRGDMGSVFPLSLTGRWWYNRAVTELYFDVAESFDPHGEEMNPLTSSGPYYLLPGGVSTEDQKNLDISAEIAAGKRWLTNRTTVRINTEQPLFYYFYNEVARNLAKLQVLFYYRDGTTGQFDVQTTNLPVQAYVQTPMHWDEVSHLATGDVVKYQVWWMHNAADVSTKITVVLDGVADLDTHIFMYRNSKGVYEIIRAKGVAGTSAKTQRDETRLKLADNAAATDRAHKNYNSSSRKSLEINTGLHSKDEIEHWLEFLDSEDVYLVQGANTLPVTIAEYSGDLHSTHSGKRNALNFTLNLNQEKNSSNGGYHL